MFKLDFIILDTLYYRWKEHNSKCKQLFEAGIAIETGKILAEQRRFVQTVHCWFKHDGDGWEFVVVLFDWSFQ